MNKMALQKAVTLDNGLTAPEAYYKIVEVRMGDRRGVSISIMPWANKAQRDANAPSLPDGKSHRFDFKADEVIVDELGNACSIKKWAYNKVKALPEFSDAVDV